MGTLRDEGQTVKESGASLGERVVDLTQDLPNVQRSKTMEENMKQTIGKKSGTEEEGPRVDTETMEQRSGTLK